MSASMAARAVLRDVGRVLDISYQQTDSICKMVPMELNMTLDKALKVFPVDPAGKTCIDCGACCNVCEYESIRDQFDRPTKYTPKENWKKPVIDAKLCNGCSLCVEDCPAYALEITPPEQPGDVHHSSVLARPDDCNACGMCERRCPVGAISMK